MNFAPSVPCVPQRLCCSVRGEEHWLPAGSLAVRSCHARTTHLFRGLRGELTWDGVRSHMRLESACGWGAGRPSCCTTGLTWLACCSTCVLLGTSETNLLTGIRVSGAKGEAHGFGLGSLKEGVRTEKAGSPSMSLPGIAPDG